LRNLSRGLLPTARGWLLLLPVTALIVTWDRSLVTLVNATAAPVAIFIAQVLAPLGSPLLHGLVGTGTVVWFRFFGPNRTRENAALLFLVSATSSGALAEALKVLFGRARPLLYLDHHVYGFHPFVVDTDYWSLPCEHAAVAGAVAVVLSTIAPECRNWLRGLAVLVAVSRVVLMRNYFSDALLGLLVGMVCATLLATAFDRMGLRVRSGASGG
jgi:membrane-associated phospholipid phosphatase